MRFYQTDGCRVGDGFVNEKLDCAVRAYSIARGIPYSDAHMLFKQAGRLDRHKTYLEHYQKLGFNFCLFDGTVAQFVRLHPRGRYYIGIRGHAMALVDGVIYDTGYIPKRAKIKYFVNFTYSKEKP